MGRQRARHALHPVGESVGVVAGADDVGRAHDGRLRAQREGMKGQVYRFPFRRVNGRRHSINAKRGHVYETYE